MTKSQPGKINGKTAKLHIPIPTELFIIIYICVRPVDGKMHANPTYTHYTYTPLHTLYIITFIILPSKSDELAAM